MRRFVRGLVLAGAALSLLVSSLPATASPPEVSEAVETFDYTKNMKPLGYSPRMIPDPPEPGNNVFNSDLAFWGNHAIQGTYAGFRIIDVSSPAKPREIINWEECYSATSTAGNQGDIVIWGDLIFRAWNSPTPIPQDADGNNIPPGDPARYTTPGAYCGDWPMYRLPADETPAGFGERGQEGVHVIDISDPTNPEVLGYVNTLCGSHTLTGVPDVENNRMLIYSSPSAGTFLAGPDVGHPEVPTSCRGIDILEFPLDAPETASYLRFLPAGHPDDSPADHHPCHDNAVILGDANLMACAGGTGAHVYSIGAPGGGSKDNPEYLYSVVTGSPGISHSAAFTWDGEVLLVSHEPGGGGRPACPPTGTPLSPPISGATVQTDEMKSMFFYEARTGEPLGMWTHERDQTELENCTVHNYNVVPTDKAYVVVSGNYQAGISAVDFSDPANPYEFAYADPAPLVNPVNPNAILLGGSWSAYWYNGRIYDSDIRRGLMIWNLADPRVAGAKKLDHLNPQTTMFTFDKSPAFGKGPRGPR
jgi:hypothetical protein